MDILNALCCSATPRSLLQFPSRELQTQTLRVNRLLFAGGPAPGRGGGAAAATGRAGVGGAPAAAAAQRGEQRHRSGRDRLQRECRHRRFLDEHGHHRWRRQRSAGVQGQVRRGRCSGRGLQENLLDVPRRN